MTLAELTSLSETREQKYALAESEFSKMHYEKAATIYKEALQIDKEIITNYDFNDSSHRVGLMKQFSDCCTKLTVALFCSASVSEALSIYRDEQEYFFNLFSNDLQKWFVNKTNGFNSFLLVADFEIKAAVLGKECGFDDLAVVGLYKGSIAALEIPISFQNKYDYSPSNAEQGYYNEIIDMIDYFTNRYITE